MTFCTAALGTFWDCSSKVTVAKAMMPSVLIWWAPAAVYGLVTERTCGNVATLSSMARARACTAGSLTVPVVECRTIWSELPETAGNSFCKRFNAVADGVLGSWNLVLNALPAARSGKKKPINATSHRIKMVLRRRKHNLARVFTWVGPPGYRLGAL